MNPGDVALNYRLRVRQGRPADRDPLERGRDPCPIGPEPGRRGARDDAWNLRNGLQIVPGLAMPIGLGPSRGDNALFLYLSFEHPFRRKAR